MNILTGINYYPLIFIIIFVVLLPIYLRAERLSGFKKATALKLILSGLCTVCALFGFISGDMYDISRLFIVVAMVFAIFGDYYLQYIRLNENKFNLGISAFGMTQIFLIISLSLRNGFSLFEIILTAIFSLSVLLLMIKQKWELGKAKIPLNCYTLLLTYMTSKAIMALFGDSITVNAIFMAAGGVLFLTSDFFLGIWNYHTDKRLHVNLCWIAYFCAIMCIALSNGVFG